MFHVKHNTTRFNYTQHKQTTLSKNLKEITQRNEYRLSIELKQ